MPPLNTNRCKKHQIAHVEEVCPECARETYANNLNMTEEFFAQHGRDTIILRGPGGVKDTITINGLFQYFRMRLIDELNPPQE